MTTRRATPVGVKAPLAAPDRPCPCGAGRTYAGCCGPVHEGVPAATPEALMRSRYTAFRDGHVAHLLATTHPGSPHAEADAATWAADLRRYCAATAFDGLTVLGAGEHASEGWVHFEARLRQGGRSFTMVERSKFIRVDGRWFYVDGTG